MALRAHPERRTGAELIYLNEKKFRRYVPTPASSLARRRRISSPSYYGQDEYNPFTLIPSKVLASQMGASESSDSNFDEVDNAGLSRINTAGPTPAQTRLLEILMGLLFSISPIVRS